jgi:2,3-bisphosphoglycerate-dependent phosphoglycerate mutase
MLNFDPTKTCVGFLVRHGELNVGNRWDGWESYSLSAEGRNSAEKAAQWLSFEKIGRLISSDLPRTLQTADILLNNLDISCSYLATDPNLRAWALGIFSGKEKTPERKERLQYYRDHPDEMIPEGESWNQLHDRVKVILQYLATPYDALPTVIVLHNSVLKALLDLDESGDLVKPGGIVAAYLTEKGDFDFQPALGGTSLDADANFEGGCG